MKLNLGAGETTLPGYTAVDRKLGTEVYPLAAADGSIEEIRASHVLEHFPHGQIPAVLKDWVRALAPGCELRIAVPNFQKIAEDYLAGKPQMTEGYVMGGQTDADDFHKAIFDADHLKKLMAGAGLMLIREWKSEIADCASLPISLNLRGVKPHLSAIGVSGAMSVPRTGFMDNFFCCFEALPPLNVKLRRGTGAYWGQCLERVLEQTLVEDNPDAVLTLDYDTVFTRRDASMLMQLMCCHPEADAITAVQSGRGKETPLFTIKGPDGANACAVAAEEFEPDLTRVATAHFGLTLLRASKLRDLSKPWFHSVPAPDGTWGEGRRDADIAFWDKWAAAGNSLYLANRVPVGHLDLMVLWPGKDFRAVYQPVSEYRETGISKEAWT